MRGLELEENNTYIKGFGRVAGVSEGPLSLSLQFFAKDGPGGEKTEEPTAKKLSDARKDGQVAKSKDLSSSVLLLVSFLVLKNMVSSMGNSFISCFRENYTRIGDFFTAQNGEFDSFFTVQLLRAASLDMLLMLLPFFAVGVVVAIVIEIVQVRWRPTTKPLQPKLSKFNPINGVKRLFSVRTLMEL